jgi:hypothetical protein
MLLRACALRGSVVGPSARACAAHGAEPRTRRAALDSDARATPRWSSWYRLLCARRVRVRVGRFEKPTELLAQLGCVLVSVH